MKKQLVLVFILSFFTLLFGCSSVNYNEKNLGENTDNSYSYEKNTYEHGTAKEILSRDIKYFPDTKVKEHTYESTRKYEFLPKIIRFKTKYLYLYANSQAEEIFNLINARDKDALMQKFSIYTRTKNVERLSWEADVLFKYVDEAIVDYDEDQNPITISEYFSYGECLETTISTDVTAHADSKDFMFNISFTLADEDESKIGVSWIAVTTKEIDEYWDNNYNPSTDNKVFGSSDNPNVGIQCQSKDYHFGVDGVPVYD